VAYFGKGGIEKMKNVSVVGIGKLGLAFSLTLEKAGYNVVGVDINEEYVKGLNNKTFVSEEPNVTEYLNAAIRFKATTNLQEAILHSDILFVIVATPSLDGGRYDHSQIDNLVEALEALPRHGQHKHFVVCCTPMPGYCESIKERLANINYTVSYNPEFIAQGTILHNQAYPDMILIGEGSEAAGDILQEIYEKHTDNAPRVCRMSLTEAEITKMALNCFLTTKIAYANMIGDIVLAAGGEPATVLNAIGSDCRIGNKYLGYGYGYGGPCFPRDNRALALYAGDLNIEAHISVASDAANKAHLKNQIERYILEHPNREKVSFDFVTYKPESTLLVESQQLAFALGLAQVGYPVEIKERKSVIAELQATYGFAFSYVEREDDE
jgi:UDPglucose 6-dehydrogenase